MTKLEDKLLASVSKPQQANKVEKQATAEQAPAKKAPATTAKKKPAKKKKTVQNKNQSALHPQRIWPD